MSPFNKHALEMAFMEFFAKQGYSYKSSDTNVIMKKYNLCFWRRWGNKTMAIRYYTTKVCSLSTSAPYRDGKRNVGRWKTQREAMANAT